jgi:probable HAF family extracellular repeat protein
MRISCVEVSLDKMKTITREQAKQTCAARLPVGRAGYEVVDLGPFENNRNRLSAINDRGQMVGVSMNHNSGRIEAFLEGEGKRVALGTLGGSFSIAHDINNHGEVVGGSLTKGDESFHGFLYRNRRLQDLNELLEPGASGWEMIHALAINNLGEIVGIASQNGQDRIVLLRPRT